MGSAHKAVQLPLFQMTKEITCMEFEYLAFCSSFEKAILTIHKSCLPEGKG